MSGQCKRMLNLPWATWLAATNASQISQCIRSKIECYNNCKQSDQVLKVLNAGKALKHSGLSVAGTCSCTQGINLCRKSSAAEKVQRAIGTSRLASLFLPISINDLWIGCAICENLVPAKRPWIPLFMEQKYCIHLTQSLCKLSTSEARPPQTWLSKTIYCLI